MKELKLVQLDEAFEDSLKSIIRAEIQKLEEVINLPQQEDYLSRKSVAKMLQVDLSTLHNWVKRGKLKSYGIGSRVYFKRTEVEQALKPLSA